MLAEINKFFSSVDEKLFGQILFFMNSMEKPRQFENEPEAMEDNRFKETVKSRKQLAQERTILANERNTLAYIRTGFSAFVLGVAAIKLFESDGFFLYAGWIAVVIGILFIIFGLVYYSARKKKIKSY